jgi:hypothetical protein
MCISQMLLPTSAKDRTTRLAAIGRVAVRRKGTREFISCLTDQAHPTGDPPFQVTTPFAISHFHIIAPVSFFEFSSAMAMLNRSYIELADIWSKFAKRRAQCRTD